MQNTRLITFILRHYLKFDKTQPFISITAILAFLGVGVGVMVLLVTMSIMNGMIKEFEHKLFIMNYPITIFSTSNKGLSKELLEYLEEKFPKLKFSPYMQTQAVIRMNTEIYPLVVYAIDLEREREVNKVLYESRTKEFSNTFNLIMGETFYYSLGLHSDEKVTLIFTELAPTGIALTPKMKKFGIDGTFASGLRNYDNSIVYTTFEALQALRSGVGDETYEGFHIFSNEPMKDIESIRLAIDAYMQESGKIVHAEAQGWWEQNGNFFAAMELEKKALFLVLMLIILMASLNIISSLLMVVMNRRKEIALLISLGASKKHVKQIFFRLGVVIGGSGIIFGIIGSFIVMWILKTFDIISIPADVYGVSRLPIELLWTDLLWTVIGACIIVCLSSYYPAKKASQIDVLQVLRNE